MKNSSEISIELHWDKCVVPEDMPRKRGLLIDVTGIARKLRRRTAINLSLVIDRSGSMSGQNIEAAKEAAMGVVDRLGDDDVLSVVAFDDKVSTLVNGLRLTKEGKHEAMHAIEQLSARGTTNLAGGWLEGASRAAESMEKMGFKAGQVVLLSDGQANVGVQDPGALRMHADEMASRGISTSTVGVGDNYSPLQLEALSEGGLGRLHDAANPEEMIEAILGELGEITTTIARDAEVTIRWPREVGVEFLADYRAESIANGLSIRIGQIVGGATRSLPFIVQVPAMRKGAHLPFEVTLTCVQPDLFEKKPELCATTDLRVVSARESRLATRNIRVAQRISLLWESTLGLEAMRLNEAGDYASASRFVADRADALGDFSVGTDIEDGIRRNLSTVQDRVANRWEGRTKRESMVAAKKFSKGEQDHRSGQPRDWRDEL